jgi:hypothetical protein
VVEPELRHYREQILDINRSAADVIRDLTDEQLLWRPSPSAWSITQCIDHLVTVSRTELPGLRRAIDEGRSRRLFRQGPYRYGVLGALLTKAMGPSVRLRFKAPRVYLPGKDRAPADVVRDFFGVQQELLDCIEGANGLDLARVKVPVFDSKYVRLSLGQEFKLFVVHEQRHIQQAQRVRDALYRGAIIQR